MAVTLADVVAFLRTDDKELKAGLKQADAEVEGWAGKLSGAIGGAALGIAAAAGTALVGATLAVGKAALDISSEVATATANLGAQLGLQADEAAKYAEIAKQVYGNNFAESVTDAADAIATVAQQLELTADDPSLQRITENAFRLKDVFGTDVSESVDAAKTLMENFGLSSDEAFKMLSYGYQQGLDRSGDFLDTIGEYSTQFKEGGASAYEFFGFLESGLQGGMLGTDKAADAFKEFRLRIQDGSDTTINALSAIGINADEMYKKMASGDLDAATAFGMVRNALSEVDDKNLQMQAGVALLGSQFEDLGMQIVSGLRMAEPDFDKLDSSISSLDAKYTTFGSLMEGVGRRLQVSLAPLGDKLLELGNRLMPLVVTAVEALIGVITPLIGALVGAVDAVINLVGSNQSLNEAFENVGGVLTATFVPLFERVQGLLAVFGAVVKHLVDQNLEYFRRWIAQNLPRIQQIVATVLGAITGVWNAHGAGIVAAVQRYLGWVVDFWSMVMQTLGNIVQIGLQLLTGDFEGAGETLRTIAGQWWTFIANALAEIWQAITAWIAAIDWGEVVASLGALWEAVAGWFGSIDWGELGRSAVEGIAGGIAAAAGAIGAAIGAVFAPILGWLGNLGGAAQAQADGPLAYLVQWWAENLPRLQQIAGAVVDAITTYWRVLSTVVTAVVTTLLSWLNQWFGQNLRRLQQDVDAILGALAALWALFGDEITAIVTTLFGWITRFMDAQFRTLLDLASAALQLLTGDFEGAGETLRGIVTRWSTTLRSIFGEMIDGILALWRAVDWAGIGRAIVDGIWAGLRAAWGGLQSWFADRLQEWRNMLPFSEPKDPASPLRGLAKAGTAIVQQVRTGIERAGGWTLPDMELPSGATIVQQVHTGIERAGGWALPGLQPAGAAVAPGPVSITITINNYGVSDGAGVGRASRDGVLEALRSAGWRG